MATTITLKINERSKAGKTFKDLIDIFSSQPGIEVITEEQPNAKTLASLKEAKEGKVIRAKNAKELMKKLLS